MIVVSGALVIQSRKLMNLTKKSQKIGSIYRPSNINVANIRGLDHVYLRLAKFREIFLSSKVNGVVFTYIKIKT